MSELVKPSMGVVAASAAVAMGVALIITGFVWLVNDIRDTGQRWDDEIAASQAWHARASLVKICPTRYGTRIYKIDGRLATGPREYFDASVTVENVCG
jgi:hypothetical protein